MTRPRAPRPRAGHAGPAPGASGIAALAGRALLAACACAALAAPARPAAEEWAFQVSGGAVWNLRTPLEIRQDGAADLRLSARWETRPFERPPYYVLAVTRREGRQELALELVHHKLYLLDPPAEIAHFAISHGYNLLLLGYGHRVRGPLWARAGGGLVVAHPENEVRGERLAQDQGVFGLGYHLTGAAASFLVEWRQPLLGALYAAAGARVTAAWAVVPVADGTADVPNVAGHATLGVGIAL